MIEELKELIILIENEYQRNNILWRNDSRYKKINLNIFIYYCCIAKLVSILKKQED